MRNVQKLRLNRLLVIPKHYQGKSPILDQIQFDISFKFQTSSANVISNILSLMMADDVVTVIGLIRLAPDTQSLKQRRISWGGIFDWKFKFNFPPDEVAGQTSTTLIITKPSIIVLVFTLHDINTEKLTKNMFDPPLKLRWNGQFRKRMDWWWKSVAVTFMTLTSSANPDPITWWSLDITSPLLHRCPLHS